MIFLLYKNCNYNGGRVLIAILISLFVFISAFLIFMFHLQRKRRKMDVMVFIERFYKNLDD